MSRVFPVQGFQGPIHKHHGQHIGGSDLMANRGTPVVAMQAGLVTLAGLDPTGGNIVLIVGDDGLTYYYAHGDRLPAVMRNSRAGAGAFLFGVGTTGNAIHTPPHLHIGVGFGIQDGTGAAGGMGINFNAVELLRSVHQGENGSAPSPAGSEQFRVANTDGLGLRLREQPGLSAGVVKMLEEGAIVAGTTEVREAVPWRLVRDSEGAVGFVSDEFLAPDGRRYRVVNTGVGLRLRAQPSLSASTLKILGDGTLLEGTTLERDNFHWRRVRDAAGAAGFAADEFLAPA